SAPSPRTSWPSSPGTRRILDGSRRGSENRAMRQAGSGSGPEPAPAASDRTLLVWLRTAIGIGALLTGSCSASCVAYSVWDFPAGTHPETAGVSLGAAALAAGVALAAGIVAKRALWPSEQRDRVEQEQKILGLAETSGGRVTVAEVAAHCRLSLEESRKALDA